MLKNFQLHIDSSHFPGYNVKTPFYIIVQYGIKEGMFDGVKNVSFPFSAVGTLYNSHKLKVEIEKSAMNNFESLYKVAKNTAELNGEEIENLKSQITY